jgi:hypothetical protein
VEGGTAHGLSNIVCRIGAPPSVYKGGRGRRQPKGCTLGGGGVLLGLPPKWRRPPNPTPTRSREGRGKGEGKGGGAPPKPRAPFGPPKGGGGAPAPLWAGVPPLHGPYGPCSSPGGSGNPSDTPINIWNLPEHFRCPNTIIQYINLYLSTISRLLVMSMISSRTLNNIRSPNHITHIILNRHRTLSVWTLRVRE